MTEKTDPTDAVAALIAAVALFFGDAWVLMLCAIPPRGKAAAA